jgi:uncharacterized membrane protein YeaQ/YmgE (transglycosylase-associated protein family)
MSLMWLLIIGVVAGTAAKLAMREENTGGLFVLGIAGALIVGTIQYSEARAIGVVAPILGAALLLGAHAALRRRPSNTDAVDKDYPRAA